MTATEMIGQMLESSRWMLAEMLKDMEGKALLFRPAAGRGNHALWLLGHVAFGEAQMAAWGGAKIDVPPVGDPAKFAMGSTPVADAAAYPSKQQLLDYAAAVRKQVLAGLAKIEPADLAKPCAGQAPEFFKSRGQCWQIIVSHEMMHVGQLAVVRKELSLPPVLG